MNERGLLKKFARTDLGNVARLLAYCGHRFRYVEAWRRFMVWDGRRWEEDSEANKMLALTADVSARVFAEAKQEEDEEERKELKAWASTSQSYPRRRAIVELVKGEADAQCAPKEFDANPWLLNVNNGVLDLRTGELKPHNSNYKQTRVCDISFDPKAKAPLWESFITRVVPDPEVRAFLQRYIGYCLTGDVTAKMLCVLHGENGNNGKTVFAVTIQKMLEPYGIAINSDVLLARGSEPHPTELADLFGTRLAVCSEVKKGREWDEEKLKRLTGNDVIRARRMHENFWQFDPTAKFLVLANLRPQVNDTSNSFWNRIALVPFNVTIPDDEIDPDLVNKLKREFTGILNWALEGCLAYQNGGLRLPEAVRKARDEYRADEDLVGAFIQDALVVNPMAKVTSADLMRAAKEWCEARNVRAFGPRKLSERLRQCGTVRQTNTNSIRGWEGVGVRNTWRKVK